MSSLIVQHFQVFYLFRSFCNTTACSISAILTRQGLTLFPIGISEQRKQSKSTLFLGVLKLKSSIICICCRFILIIELVFNNVLESRLYKYKRTSSWCSRLPLMWCLGTIRYIQPYLCILEAISMFWTHDPSHNGPKLIVAPRPGI